MSSTHELHDVDSTGVQAACAAVDEAISRLSLTGDEQAFQLRLNWAELVAVLIEAHALTPAHELRATDRAA